MRERLHQSLLKVRDKYRAYIKKGRSQVLLDKYNQMLGLHVLPSREFDRARQLTRCDEEEYFGYEFYHRTDAERDAYLTRVRRDRLAIKVGDVNEALTIPGNKVLFNMIFGSYLMRRWINPSACTAEDFAGFVRSLGEVFVKSSVLAAARASTNTATQTMNPPAPCTRSCTAAARWWKKCFRSTRR